ncbi:MAG: hypothetical protein H7A38_00575 [Chlamydiales bacterium]|nr:hypothetical protein [Chlamydiales bacterium]
MKQFSMVKGEVKRRLLKRAIVLSSMGALLLLGMGLFTKVEILSTWGLPSFALGIFLVTFGMIPYRNLTKLETHPHQIIFDKEAFTFISNKGNSATVSYREITKIRCHEGKVRYGLWIERKGGVPLFLPNFLYDASLDEIVHPNETD